jgi:hypothetical protein
MRMQRQNENNQELETKMDNKNEIIYILAIPNVMLIDRDMSITGIPFPSRALRCPSSRTRIR